jgi:hypothetical protein
MSETIKLKSLEKMTDGEFSKFLFMCAFSEMDEETITIINKETSRRWGVGVFGREPVGHGRHHAPGVE